MNAATDSLGFVISPPKAISFVLKNSVEGRKFVNRKRPADEVSVYAFDFDDGNWVELEDKKHMSPKQCFLIIDFRHGWVRVKSIRSFGKSWRPVVEKANYPLLTEDDVRQMESTVLASQDE